MKESKELNEEYKILIRMALESMARQSQETFIFDVVERAINEAKKEVFDDIGRVGLSSCGFMGDGDNLCDRIEIEKIAELKQKHLGERKT